MGRDMRNADRGFTLIELLVVVFIIGLLASVVTISSTTSRAQARDAKRKSDLQLVASSLELYYAVNRTYPNSSSAWGWSVLRTSLVPEYASAVPSDPLPSRSDGNFEAGGYAYRTNDSGSNYVLDAALERADDRPTVTTGFSVEDPSNPQFYQTGTYEHAGSMRYRVSGR